MDKIAMYKEEIYKRAANMEKVAWAPLVGLAARFGTGALRGITSRFVPRIASMFTRGVAPSIATNATKVVKGTANVVGGKVPSLGKGLTGASMLMPTPSFGSSYDPNKYDNIINGMNP